MASRHRFLLIQLLPFLLVAPSSWARTPSWATHDTQRLEGHLLRVVCAGSGPSIGFARQNALDSCRVSAAEQLATELSVKSLSVSSERDVAYQQEVRNRSRVFGLSCVPRKEEIEQGEAEVKLWLLCEFDLSKARAERGGRRPDSSDEDEKSGGYSVGSYVTDDERKVLTVASIPSCSDLIVRGGTGPARIVRCEHNPVSVVIKPGDTELILRARGYLPKSIFLGPNREERGYVQVVLEPSS